MEPFGEVERARLQYGFDGLRDSRRPVCVEQNGLPVVQNEVELAEIET